ncbi:MAG TPA: nuclear transport factor 2 family protein [Sphingobium sp.]|nr:nuclear transport factor 2 family protein [Sphingobium sp.]
MTRPDCASLIEADDARFAALMASDVDALDALFTDDFTYTHNAGFTDGKQAYLARIRSGVVRYSDGERVSADTRVHGHTGVMTGHMRMVANLADQSVSIDNVFLAVWVFEDGRWRCAAWSSTTRQADGDAAPGQ